jgi:hypothetical protein
MNAVVVALSFIIISKFQSESEGKRRKRKRTERILRKIDKLCEKESGDVRGRPQHFVVCLCFINILSAYKTRQHSKHIRPSGIIK